MSQINIFVLQGYQPISEKLEDDFGIPESKSAPSVLDPHAHYRSHNYLHSDIPPYSQLGWRSARSEVKIEFYEIHSDYLHICLGEVFASFNTWQETSFSH